MSESDIVRRMDVKQIGQMDSARGAFSYTPYAAYCGRISLFFPFITGKAFYFRILVEIAFWRVGSLGACRCALPPPLFVGRDISVRFRRVDVHC